MIVGESQPRGWRSNWFATRGGQVPPALWALHLALAVVVGSGLLVWVFTTLAHYRWDWAPVWEYREKFLRGWAMTVAIASAALVLSTLIGISAALLQRAPFLPLRAAAKVYVEVIRGTPLIVQALVLYFGVFQAFGLQSPFLSGVLILSIFSGAYIGEMIRAGIEGVGRSQREAAAAVGFTRIQTYRFVIFPQAIRQILPPLAGQFASLIKDSSILSVIAIGEFTLNVREVSALTYSAFESYLPLAAGYFALTLPISMVARMLEEKFRYET